MKTVMSVFKIVVGLQTKKETERYLFSSGTTLVL